MVLPTMQVKSWGEGIVLGFFQMFGLWAARPWKVADPKAMRDVVGMGRSTWCGGMRLSEIGGLAPQRLAVLEDITLGRRMKAARAAAADGVCAGTGAGALGQGRVRLVRRDDQELIFARSTFSRCCLLGLGWVADSCSASSLAAAGGTARCCRRLLVSPLHGCGVSHDG